LAVVDAELTAAEEQLEDLRAELAAAEQARRAADAAALEAEAGVARVTRQLRRTDAELATAIGKLEARVVAAFKYGQVSLTEVLAGVRDFGDLVSSSTMVSHVLNGDRVMVADVERLLQLVADQQDEARQTTGRRRARGRGSRRRCRGDRSGDDGPGRGAGDDRGTTEEREQLFIELRDDRASAEGHLAGLEAESARIEAQLAAIAREQAAEEARRQREAEDAAAAAAEAERQQAAAEAERQRAAEEAARRAADAEPQPERADDGSSGSVADDGDDREDSGGTPAPPSPGVPDGPESAPAPLPTTWVRPAVGRSPRRSDHGGGATTTASTSAVASARPWSPLAPGPSSG
jgi:colicin import membrane protein